MFVNSQQKISFRSILTFKTHELSPWTLYVNAEEPSQRYVRENNEWLICVRPGEPNQRYVREANPWLICVIFGEPNQRYARETIQWLICVKPGETNQRCVRETNQWLSCGETEEINQRTVWVSRYRRIPILSSALRRLRPFPISSITLAPLHSFSLPWKVLFSGRTTPTVQEFGDKSESVTFFSKESFRVHNNQ